MAMITYDNKTTLNPQPSIARINKVTDDDMNEIKSVVNTNYGEVGDITTLTTTNKSSVVSAVNELKSGEIYSTNEVKTNKVFKGKPVYRKIIEISNITNTTGDNFISTEITDLETCVSLDGIFNVGVNRIPINFHNSISGNGTYSFCCFYQYTNKKIDILCKTAINSGHVIIEYTKTTD